MIFEVRRVNKLLGKVEEGAKNLANHQVCLLQPALDNDDDDDGDGDGVVVMIAMIQKLANQALAFCLDFQFGGGITVVDVVGACVLVGF